MRRSLPSSSSNIVRVLDASVVINLLAVGVSVARAVLKCRRGSYLVPHRVRREVLVDPRDPGRSADTSFGRLAAGDLIREVSVDGYADELFVDFAENLGDGEAATLAYATQCGGLPVVDDRAAIATATKNGLQVEWTVDLLLAEGVVEAVGHRAVVEAVYDALRLSRMRIPKRLLLPVVDLIGPERATNCPSLPKHVRRSVAT